MKVLFSFPFEKNKEFDNATRVEVSSNSLDSLTFDEKKIEPFILTDEALSVKIFNGHNLLDSVVLSSATAIYNEGRMVFVNSNPNFEMPNTIASDYKSKIKILKKQNKFYMRKSYLKLDPNDLKNFYRTRDNLEAMRIATQVIKNNYSKIKDNEKNIENENENE